MHRGKRFALALIAGGAAALGHAPFGLWPVSLFGFAALIYLVGAGGSAPRPPEYLQKEETQFDSNYPVLTAWGGGIGYFAVALHWIVEPFLVDVARHGWMAPFALVLLAAGLALFWALAGWVSRRTRWPAFGFALALALAEMVRGHVFTGFPWALPAYIWADTPLLQVASILGPYGLTGVTLLVLALPSFFRRVWLGSGIAVMWLAAAALWGFANGHDPELASDTLGTIRLVQPNAPQHEKWDPDKAHIFVERAIELSAAPGEANLIVWPETAVPYPLDLAAPVLARASASAGRELVTGINRRTDDGQWFNALVTVAETGLVRDTYDKVHLVPFGEYIPFRIGFLRDMAGFAGFGFSAGPAVRTIDTSLGQALPLICYEAIFPGHGRGVERPDYLLQITNDAWFGTFSGPFQHLDQARFRAVEMGVPLVRAANTGVSAVIDHHGRVIDTLALGKAGYLDVAVPSGTTTPPVYARLGDWPIALLLGLVLAGLTFSRRRLPAAG